MNRAVILILLLVFSGLGLAGIFTVNETEYAIRFQLGRIVKVDYQPGLHFKWPFVNNIRKFDKRILTLDTQPELMLTSEQKYVNVDSFVKWRIVDVARFYTSTQGNEAIALNRLHGTIRVYTFEPNRGARRFYERHGFSAIAFGDGSNNESRCPDVLYERQLPTP